jgi:mortality factor 4-like protein 1
VKLDDAGLERQKQLTRSHKNKVRRDQSEGKTVQRATLKQAKADQAIVLTARPAKRGRESTVDEDSDWKIRPEIKLSFPDAAKVQLVDDWEAVSKQNKVGRLGCSTTKT